MKSPSSHNHLGGENRKAEPVCHQRPARSLHPLLELQLPKEKIPGVEQEAPQGLVRRQPCPFPEHSPPWWGPGAWEDEGAELPFLEFDLGMPPELGPDVHHFLQELASSTREDSGSDSSPEPPAEEYERWVTWWGQILNMPDWWQELVEIPEVDNYWELAWMIWASFKLTWQMSKLHDVGNYYLAPLAPPCLHQKDFLLLPN